MRKKQQLKLVSSNIFLEESTPWKIFSVIILLIAIIVLLLVIWSAFTKINETAKVFGQITPLQQEVIRHTIKSPVDGIVNTLELKPGNVIDPGEKLLEIVPVSQGVVINARLSTTDVGHVKIGDPAKIKVLTYDYSRYGVLNGSVIDIAANSKVTKQGTPFYEVTIKPEKSYVDNNKELSLKPGMTVEADIITGEKTVLAYLLNPIHRSLSKALTER